MADSVTMDKIVSLCKRRGFIFPGSEIYGGLANTWDYGPYGVELANNIKRLWWKYFIQNREDMVGLDAGIFMNSRVWEASGHISSFSDPLMDCKSCKERVRGDKLIEQWAETHGNKYPKHFAGEKTDPFDLLEFIMDEKIVCPSCHELNWTKPRRFNLMFETHQGVTEGDKSLIYLRPETAQGIFVNFKNIVQSNRKRIPFGIGQVGKAFRNEITPGNFIFRTREFEQMEIEYFVHENEWKSLYDDWRKTMENFYLDVLCFKKEKMRWRQHEQKELSHYSKETWDVEYEFPFGWGELWGIAYRTDFDLKQHSANSGELLDYLDPDTGLRFMPHCIEPTFGLNRTLLTALVDAYAEDLAPSEKEGTDEERRIVLKFHPSLAPVKVSILPLMKKLKDGAYGLYQDVKKHFVAEFDDSGSIGKRYRRQDEIGTPFCVTFDFQSLDDKAVTVRHRDSMQQERVKIDNLILYLSERLL
ncbi:glycine--tRNA ligase [Candidatus Peregrinibacteria bacterium]|nr:glycine--tRNA ligase [Candidatus Peregrinibacteria bacterium]